MIPDEEPRGPSDPRTPSGSHGSAPPEVRPDAPDAPDAVETLRLPAVVHEPTISHLPVALPAHLSARMAGYPLAAIPGSRPRLMWRVMAGISILTISALLAACFYFAALPVLQSFAGSQESAPLGQTMPGQPGGHQASTPATATASTQASSDDWYSEPYTGTNVRFRIDIPAMLACAHGFFINDFSGFGCDYSYSGAPAQTDLQRVEQETQVEILSSTKITDRNICPQGGTQVRVGAGAETLFGWERDDVSATTSDGKVTLNLIVHGAPIQIVFQGFGGEPQPFFERYGAIWRHMLASFTLLPALVIQTVHPCG